MTRPIATGASQAASARVAGAGVVLAVLAASVACTEQEPVPRLDRVSPQRLHTDRPQRLRLVGAQLLPRYDVDLSSGRRQADANGFSGLVGSGPGAQVLRDFVSFGPGTLEATLDPGLPAGIHDVTVIDPRGAPATLSPGFISLGLDTTPPVLTIVAPAAASQLAPGTPVAGRASIEDDGVVRDFAWEARGPRGPVLRGPCAMVPTTPVVPPSGRWTCDFNFVVPPQLRMGDVFQVLLTATDDAPRANRATLSRSFRLQSRPFLTSVLPAIGGAAGGTDVIVRGGGFRPGTRVALGGRWLDPDGGILLNDGAIVGKSPAHEPGAADVRVVTPLGDAPEEAVFEYLANPTLTAIEPAHVPSKGGLPVKIRGQHFTSATQIYFGDSLATAVALGQRQYVDASEIRGIAPSGEGPATVFAVDPTAGWASLPAGFTWEAGP